MWELLLERNVCTGFLFQPLCKRVCEGIVAPQWASAHVALDGVRAVIPGSRLTANSAVGATPAARDGARKLRIRQQKAATDIGKEGVLGHDELLGRGRTKESARTWAATTTKESASVKRKPPQQGAPNTSKNTRRVHFLTVFDVEGFRPIPTASIEVASAGTDC